MKNGSNTALLYLKNRKSVTAVNSLLVQLQGVKSEREGMMESKERGSWGAKGELD